MGSSNNVGTRLASAELYDPQTRTFRATATPLTTMRDGATATSLPDGSVLIAGGDAGLPLKSAELYLPAAETFRPIVSQMQDAREFHTATR